MRKPKVKFIDGYVPSKLGFEFTVLCPLPHTNYFMHQQTGEIFWFYSMSDDLETIHLMDEDENIFNIPLRSTRVLMGPYKTKDEAEYVRDNFPARPEEKGLWGRQG